MLIEMKVVAVEEDEIFEMKVVILKSIDKEYYLKIYVDYSKGKAIEYCLKENQLLRPLPHDIILKIFQLFNIKLEKIIISDNTFYAVMILNYNDSLFEIDCILSDAIAIAVRCKSSIFVTEEILKRRGIRFRISEDEKNL